MKKVRAAVVPILFLAVVYALAWFNIDVPVIADFLFIWDVLLGVVLGVGFGMLPPLSGFAVRRNAATGMFWLAGFLTLLLVFYQYMTAVTGMQLDFLAFMHPSTTRVRIVEGAVLGYCSVIASRGKV